MVPLLAAALLAYAYRQQLFGLDLPVRIAVAGALVVLGWAFARDIGRAVAPALFRRLDPATAGTVGFLIRLGTVLIAILVALSIGGVRPQTVALGGALTAVVFGLAAQQTLGHLIAGTVLLSARPFRVGERIQLQAGGLAGSVEGVVGSLGLLHTTLVDGHQTIMVPNTLVLNSAITPLGASDSTDLRARLPVDVGPSELQVLLDEFVSVPTRSAPNITLEEVDGNEVLVRIVAVPLVASDGPALAQDILRAIARAADQRHPAPSG